MFFYYTDKSTDPLSVSTIQIFNRGYSGASVNAAITLTQHGIAEAKD